MSGLNKKIKKAQVRIIRKSPDLVRTMTNVAANYFKVAVFRGQGYDVQPSSVNGGRWAPRKKKRVGRLMVKTGRARRSITANSRGKVGVVSSMVPYVAFHQKGAGSLPIRKMIGPSRILNRKFDKMIRKQLQKAFEK